MGKRAAVRRVAVKHAPDGRLAALRIRQLGQLGGHVSLQLRRFVSLDDPLRLAPLEVQVTPPNPNA